MNVVHFLQLARIAGVSRVTLAWLLAGLFPLLGEAADWPRFLGPTQDSRSAETNLNLSWDDRTPPVLWEMALGPSFSSPVVSGGRALIFDRVGDRERVSCRDLISGASVWASSYPSEYRDRYGYNNGPRAAPCIAAGRVYTYGAGGTLSCFDLPTGSKIWRRALNTELAIPQAFFGVGASPIVEGELLLLNAGGPKAHGILALACEDGTTRWHSTDDGASYATPLVSDIGASRVACFFTARGFVAADVADGRVRASFPFRSPRRESVNAASPLLVGDRVLLSAAYKVGAVMFRLGEEGTTELWRKRDAMQSHWSPLIHDDGYVYGFSGQHRRGTTLRCIRVSDGVVVWESGEDLGRGTMLGVQQHLIVLGERGDLVLVELRHDRHVERVRIPGVLSYPAWTPPVLSDGVLLLRDETRLIALDLRRR